MKTKTRFGYLDPSQRDTRYAVPVKNIVDLEHPRKYPFDLGKLMRKPNRQASRNGGNPKRMRNAA